MKVALITGSYPPDACGVGDYTARLAECLRGVGVGVEVFKADRWGMHNVPVILRKIQAIDADVIHMQYPTAGYGWKIGPQLMSLLAPFVITIHECSQRHLLRKISLYPFSFISSKIIFTSEYERSYAQRFAPWIENRSAVIPIGSNIPLSSARRQNGTKVVTYFGLIQPGKGVEQVIALARIFKMQKRRMRVRIVGKVNPTKAAYFRKIQSDTQELPIEWVLGLDEKELSRVFAETKIAYLPFPDGASERRGSLIALLSHGVAVLTSVGQHTPPDMQKAVIAVNSPNEAAILSEQICSNSERAAVVRTRAAAYARKFSWERIAAEHVAVYRQTIFQKSHVISVSEEK